MERMELNYVQPWSYYDKKSI